MKPPVTFIQEKRGGEWRWFIYPAIGCHFPGGVTVDETFQVAIDKKAIWPKDRVRLQPDNLAPIDTDREDAPNIPNPSLCPIACLDTVP